MTLKAIWLARANAKHKPELYEHAYVGKLRVLSHQVCYSPTWDESRNRRKRGYLVNVIRKRIWEQGLFVTCPDCIKRLGLDCSHHMSNVVRCTGCDHVTCNACGLTTPIAKPVSNYRGNAVAAAVCVACMEVPQ